MVCPGRVTFETLNGGAQVVATVTNDADEIRRQMGLIRRELHQDVREVVQKAEAAADWQRYIRNFPWVSVGLAFAVGYVVVPKRRRQVPRDVARAADVAEVREAVRQGQKEERQAQNEEQQKEQTKKSLLVAAWATLSPIAIRLAQSYAIQYLENWLLQQQQQTTAGPPPPPRQPSEPGWSGGTRGGY